MFSIEQISAQILLIVAFTYFSTATANKFDDTRCVCTCIQNSTQLRRVIGDVDADMCNCKNVEVLPSKVTELGQCLNTCVCKYQSRNILLVKATVVMTLIALFILILYMIFLLFVYPKWYKSRHKIQEDADKINERKISRTSIRPNGSVRGHGSRAGSMGPKGSRVGENVGQKEKINENGAKRPSIISQMSVQQQKWMEAILVQRERGLTAG